MVILMLMPLAAADADAETVWASQGKTCGLSGTRPPMRGQSCTGLSLLLISDNLVHHFIVPCDDSVYRSVKANFLPGRVKSKGQIKPWMHGIGQASGLRFLTSGSIGVKSFVLHRSTPTAIDEKFSLATGES